jgi:hypothetical protein
LISVNLVEIKNYILFLCIERIFGLTNGCRNLEFFFCRLKIQQYDPSAQCRRSWGTFKRKRGLALCYNCRRPRHLAKECPCAGPIFLCCKIVGHEVENCPKMIAKVERMNMRQKNYEGSQETKGMLESHKKKETEEVQITLV